jgi:hypothetical protein
VCPEEVPDDALRGGQPELLRDGAGFASQLAGGRPHGLDWPARRTEAICWTARDRCPARSQQISGRRRVKRGLLHSSAKFKPKRVPELGNF